MSTAALTWAWGVEIDRRHSGAKHVLTALADFADEDGTCYPGQARLAAMTSQGERTVRRHLEWLESVGLIGRAHRYGPDGRRTSDRYRLALPTTGQVGQWTTGQERRDYRPPMSSLPAKLAREPSVEPPGTTSAHARGDDETIRELLAGWVAACGRRPPRSLTRQMRTRIAELVADEAVEAAQIAVALSKCATSGMGPGMLPSFAHEAARGLRGGSQPPSREQLEAELAILGSVDQDDGAAYVRALQKVRQVRPPPASHGRRGSQLGESGTGTMLREASA